MTALTAVYQAVYTTLSSDATLLALATGGVFDYVPQEPTFPYVQIGPAVELEDDTTSSEGRTVEITVSIHSQYRGVVGEALPMWDRCVTLLRHSAQTMTSWRCLYVGMPKASVGAPTMVDGKATQHVVGAFAFTVEAS